MYHIRLRKILSLIINYIKNNLLRVHKKCKKNSISSLEGTIFKKNKIKIYNNKKKIAYLLNLIMKI